MMNPSPTSYYSITPYSIQDRAYWQQLRDDPRHAALFEKVDALIATASAAIGLKPMPKLAIYESYEPSQNSKYRSI